MNNKRLHVLPPCDITWLGLTPDLVSIVLPVYNQAKFLDSAINCVLNQSYKNFELIIINDGSKDNVKKVLGKYVNTPKIKIYSQPNRGLPEALSAGFSFAKGEFWTWTSADNLMEPRQLELLSARLRSSPDLGMVYADYVVIDDRGAPLTDLTWRAYDRPDGSHRIRLPRDTARLNMNKDNFIGPCFMYRGWIGKLMGAYVNAMGIEDYDYWMRINNFFSIEHLETDDLPYQYRVHDNTLSAQAHHHKIFQKAFALMDIECIRKIFFNHPFEWVCDETSISICMPDNYSILGDAKNFILTSNKKIYALSTSNNYLPQYFSSDIHTFMPTVFIFSDNDNSLFYKKFNDQVRTMQFSLAWVSSDEDRQLASKMGISMIFDTRKKMEARYATEVYFNNRIFFKATESTPFSGFVAKLARNPSEIRKFSKTAKSSLKYSRYIYSFKNKYKKYFPKGTFRHRIASAIWHRVKLVISA